MYVLRFIAQSSDLILFVHMYISIFSFTAELPSTLAAPKNFAAGMNINL